MAKPSHNVEAFFITFTLVNNSFSKNARLESLERPNLKIYNHEKV